MAIFIRAIRPHLTAIALVVGFAGVLPQPVLAQPVAPPTVDAPTLQSLRKISPHWQADVTRCVTLGDKLRGKMEAVCDRLGRALAAQSETQPAIYAHIFGQIVLPLWLRWAPERAKGPIDAAVENFHKALPYRMRSVDTDLAIEARYLQAAMQDVQADTLQAEFLVQLAGDRLHVDVCSRPPWLKPTQKGPACPPLWQAWLREFAPQLPAQWQQWATGQMRPRLQSVDWHQRYMGAKMFETTRAKQEEDPDIVRLWSDLVLTPKVDAELVSAFDVVLTERSARAVLYPADKPTENWTWAIVPLPKIPEIATNLPETPTAAVLPPTMSPALLGKLAKLEKRIAKNAKDCQDAWDPTREEPDTRPGTCYAQKTQIAADAGAELCAHVVGKALLAGAAPPAFKDGDPGSMVEQVWSNIGEGADLRLLQAYAAYALQQHLASAANQRGANWQSRLDELLHWAADFSDVTICDWRTPASKLACAAVWVQWLHACVVAAPEQHQKAVGQIMRARLQSEVFEQFALGLRDLMNNHSVLLHEAGTLGAALEHDEAYLADPDEERVVPWGARQPSPAMVQADQIAIWARRNWLLKKDLPENVGKSLDPDIPAAALRELLYPARLDGLEHVDLTKPPK